MRIARRRNFYAGVLALGAASFLGTSGLPAVANATASVRAATSQGDKPAYCPSSKAVVVQLRTWSVAGPRVYSARTARQAVRVKGRLLRLSTSAAPSDLASTSLALRSSLKGLASLASRDPRGRRRSTNEKARELADQYLSAASNFISQQQAACEAPASRLSATYPEQEGRHGVNTFTNYHNASGLGQRIQPYQWVNVSCKVYDPYIQSVNPDGYWYRIADSPWNNQYYSPANTFYNGDPVNGPYSHNTDYAVPDCGSEPPSQVPTAPAGPTPVPSPPPVVPVPAASTPPPSIPEPFVTATCTSWTGTRIADTNFMSRALFQHYAGGLGDDAVIDWSYFADNAEFVQKAKSLPVGGLVSGWGPSSKASDMFLALGHFTIARDSENCFVIYDRYDFDPKSDYFPAWGIQLFGARTFDIHASGML